MGFIILVNIAEWDEKRKDCLDFLLIEESSHLNCERLPGSVVYFSARLIQVFGFLLFAFHHEALCIWTLDSSLEDPIWVGFSD